MKSSLCLLASFATITMAATLPSKDGWYLRRADEMSIENVPIVDLRVTDERFGDEVFLGTAESIYNQMKEKKPELFANETDISEVGAETSLAKRQGSFNCDWYNNINDAVGQWWWCHEGTNYLRKLGTAWCSVDAAPACARVSCSNTCGMFLCNKIGNRLEVYCQDIANDIAAIAGTCSRSPNIGYIAGARDFSSHFIGLRGQRC